MSMLLILAAPFALAAEPKRTVSNNELVSSELPRIRIKVDPGLKYLGSFPFKIRDVAGGDRYVFAETEGHRIKRMFIVQLEGFLPGVQDEYRYRLRNPVKIGAHTYGHSTWLFDEEQVRRENPGTEPEYTAKFLGEKGLVLDRELMMARFARIVEDNSRYEIILFYMEPLQDHGLSLSRFNEDAEPTDERRKLGEELTKRALNSFTIID